MGKKITIGLFALLFLTSAIQTIAITKLYESQRISHGNFYRTQDLTASVGSTSLYTNDETDKNAACGQYKDARALFGAGIVFGSKSSRSA